MWVTGGASEFRTGIRATELCRGEVASSALSRRGRAPSPSALAGRLRCADVAAAIGFVVAQPAHVTVNELVITPAWNESYDRVPGLPED